MNEIQLFFDQVDTLSWKYDTVLHQDRHNFNIFSILRSESDEVYLHSQFLAELLNPTGSHNQGDSLLVAFLEQIELSHFRLKNAYVQIEYKNIDIFIANDSQAIILENKIYAGDQPRQLARYYELVQAEGFEDIIVIYLTLYGEAPSEQSTAGIVTEAMLYQVSYRNDIKAWLEACIKQAAQYPVLRETLVQYQRLVKKLTGQSLAQGYLMELKDLLLDKKNLKLASDISQALPEAKIAVQLAFWEDLEVALTARNHKIVYLPDSYTKEKVEKFYRGGKKRRYYGLRIKLVELDNSNIFVFYITINKILYYGFDVYKLADQRWLDTKDVTGDAIDGLFAMGKIFKQEGEPVCWKDYPILNFETFDSDAVFALADPIERSATVNAFADEVSAIIEQFKEAYQNQRQD